MGLYAEMAGTDVEKLVASYVDTPAMRQMSEGYVGSMPHASAGYFYQAIRNASNAMFKVCNEFSGLALKYRAAGKWELPQFPRSTNHMQPAGRQVRPCGFKTLHVVFFTAWYIKKRATATGDMRGTYRLRGLGLAGEMLQRGHNASFYSLRRKAPWTRCHKKDFEFPFAPGRPASSVYPPLEPGGKPVHVVAVMIKGANTKIYSCMRMRGIPVLWDLLDNTLEDIESFQNRSDVLLSSSRISAEMFTRIVPGARSSLPLYHQVANSFGFRRVDRRSPVRVVGLVHQPEHGFGQLSELALRVDAMCHRQHIVTRVRQYAGHGFEQEEMRTFVREKYDPSDQMGYAMGYSSVDIVMLWLPCQEAEHICLKPSHRMVSALSLGIPAIVIGTASYLDLAVEFGYPLVATDIDMALRMLQLLIDDADLRQTVSEIGLRLAKHYSLTEIGSDFESIACGLV